MSGLRGFTRVYAGLRSFTRCLRIVYARFAQGLRKVYAGLLDVYARFKQGLRKVYAWFMQSLRKVGPHAAAGPDVANARAHECVATRGRAGARA